MYKHISPSSYSALTLTESCRMFTWKEKKGVSQYFLISHSIHDFVHLYSKTCLSFVQKLHTQYDDGLGIRFASPLGRLYGVLDRYRSSLRLLLHTDPSAVVLSISHTTATRTDHVQHCQYGGDKVGDPAGAVINIDFLMSVCSR